MNRIFRTLAIGLFFLIGTGFLESAFAHKVNIFAYVENGKIYTESYFSDGKPVQSGNIEIFDGKKQKVASGITDQEGKYVIPVPKLDDLTIFIDASLGHKNSYLLKKSDIGD